MSLDKLVEKWRADADFHIVEARNKQWTDWVREGHAGEARRLQSCARELESALAGGGEAVAWMDHMGGVITAAMKDRDPASPYNIPLYLHPAGAVQVTDEQCEAVYQAVRWLT